MFGLSLPPVVCRRDHVILTCICVCLRIVVSKTYCVVFLFCFSSSMLPVFLDCLFWIAPSVFSHVYLMVNGTHPSPFASKFQQSYTYKQTIKSFVSSVTNPTNYNKYENTHMETTVAC